MNFFRWVVLALAACDFDHDGLGSFNEAAAGTKDLRSDTDGDGLSDGDEVLRYQTDPISADSDGDEAEDGLEVEYGFDPLDELSAPYAKGWPVTPAEAKASLADAPGKMVVGRGLLRAFLRGKEGEFVDLYDYALHRKPVMLFVGNSEVAITESEYVSGGNSLIFSKWIVQKFTSDEVAFAVVATMSSADYPRPPELSDIRRCEDVPHGCFADTSWDLFRHIDTEDPYTAILLDEQMVVIATSTASNLVPLDAAVAAALGVPPPE